MFFFNRIASSPTQKNLKKFFLNYQNPLLHIINQEPNYYYTQKSNYVDVKMKWKKDYSYDSIEIIEKSKELKAVISLKNCITKEPNNCIPISAVSKRGYELGVPLKVAKFLRNYPSIFEEFTGENYNLPWFKLSQEAIDLHEKEQVIYRDHWSDLAERLKKFILMTRDKKLPLKIIQGIQWYLGLPDDFLQNPDLKANAFFKFVEMEDGCPGLSVEIYEMPMSKIQENALKQGRFLEKSTPLALPLFPSKNLRLKRKISNWLDEFQKLPYVSPYEDSSHLRRDSDISEKRVVGVLHELLCLFVEHSAERKKIHCLQKHLGLPQKFWRAFERHPHIFYLSLKKKTCTVILKEAYSDRSALEKHPILDLRKKYIMLMNKSKGILNDRRHRQKSPVEINNADSNVIADSEVRKDVTDSEVREDFQVFA